MILDPKASLYDIKTSDLLFERVYATVSGLYIYIEQENNLPLSKGEDAVVLAQASYKSGVRVHPVGLNTVMLNLFQHLTSMKLPLLAGQILNQVQDDAVIGGVPC